MYDCDFFSQITTIGWSSFKWYTPKKPVARFKRLYKEVVISWK